MTLERLANALARAMEAGVVPGAAALARQRQATYSPVPGNLMLSIAISMRTSCRAVHAYGRNMP